MRTRSDVVLEVGGLLMASGGGLRASAETFGWEAAAPGDAGFSPGGQRLFVFPTLDFGLAVTAGNYDAEDSWRPPLALLREVFLPNLVG